MRGEFIGIWSETSSEAVLPLTNHEGIGKGVFCELSRALAPTLPGIFASRDVDFVCHGG